MKQIIEKYHNSKIHYKYYVNHLNQKNGLSITYHYNGNIWWKTNYLNDKLFGLDNWYDNNKQYKITYHL